tara:strand:+ start:8760 stop:9095 length:336 start_codon:yes stop_codon:yes gene_type:complete
MGIMTTEIDRIKQRIFEFDASNLSTHFDTSGTFLRIVIEAVLPCGKKLQASHSLRDGINPDMIIFWIETLKSELEESWKETVSNYSAHKRIQVLNDYIKANYDSTERSIHV